MNVGELKGEKITRLRLDRMPLPNAGDSDDKEDRGVVLVVGGSNSVPGALLLAGEAALRAGAGKLQLATVKPVSLILGMALPEALVVSLPTTRSGEIAGTQAALSLSGRVGNAMAVLIGPGMTTEHGQARSLVERLVPYLLANATLVLDGAAAVSLGENDALLERLAGRAIITPHAGEMASLLEIPREEVVQHAAEVAQHCANRFGVTTVLKGSETYIAHPAEPLMYYVDGKVGLGTSGSGDVLAGIIAGLSARGAAPRTAAAWGVWVHGSAGNKLSRSVGKVGFLARELSREIPGLIA